MRREVGKVVVVAAMMLVASSAYAGDANESETTVAPVAVQRVSGPMTGLRDEAAMVLVGTALIGLAAAVRRAG